MIGKSNYDQYDFINYVATYVMTTLGGGKITYSSNAMFDDASITLKWEKYDTELKKTLRFEYKITLDDITNIKDPAVLGKMIVDKYRETQKQTVSPFPRSAAEKKAEFKKNPEHIEHWMFVGELIELLQHLKPDDWVTPNNVHNLTISREPENENEKSEIGWIDFASNNIEFSNGLEDIGPFGEEAKNV